MSSEVKSVQELLAEKKANRRTIYQRPRLTKSQLAAYYGLPDMSIGDNENDDEGIEVEEEFPPPEARIPAPETPKRRSRDLTKTSKASITFSKSVLDVFDKTKSVQEERDEDEPYDEQMDAETSKASITFSLSVLAVFDKTKTTEEEESEEDEQTDAGNAEISEESSQGPNETSKASITFSKSVLAVFDKTKTVEEDSEEEDDDEHMDAEIVEKSKESSQEPSETSKASLTFSKSVLAVFDKTKTVEEESEEEDADEQTVGDIVETSKENCQSLSETSKASLTFSKSVLAVFDKTKTTEEAVSEEDEQIEVETVKTSKFPNVHIPSPICTKKLNPPSLPKPKVHVTPRKSIAVQRKVKDHSFNAAKLPVLNSSLFDGLPKAQPSIQKSHPDSRPNVDIPAAANVDFINATPEDDDDVEKIINDLDDPSLDNENEFQSPRRILQPVEDFVPPTTNTDFLNATLTEDNARKNTYDYDNDAANFSAASAPDDFDEEPIEQENVEPTFNDSVYSIHTPGTSRLRPILRSKPSIPLRFNDTLEESGVIDKSVVKITAGLNKNKMKVRYVLPKPKLIQPESPSIEQPNLRRSRRTRVHRLRSDLGQVPIYEYDQDGDRTLVDVASVEILNPRAQKYFTVDAEEQNKREKQLKDRRKSRKEFAKKQRGRETRDY